MRACSKSPPALDMSRWRNAKVAREVIGVDLTEAPLKIAERMRAEGGLQNVSFRVADVEARLPFDDNEFDVVVCRFAVHHFENPAIVIAEMARVCRVEGTSRWRISSQVSIRSAPRVRQPLRAPTRHVAYTRACAQRVSESDGIGGIRDYTLRFLGAEKSGRSMVRLGPYVTRPRRGSACNDRARSHRGFEWRASLANRRRTVLHASPRDRHRPQIEVSELEPFWVGRFASRLQRRGEKEKFFRLHLPSVQLRSDWLLKRRVIRLRSCVELR